jgi:hypothetical protein
MMVLSDFLSIKDMKQRIMYLLANAYQDQARKINLQITPKRIQDFFLTVINDAIEHREKNNIRRNDYFDMLLQLKNVGKLEGDTTNVGKISYTDLTAACFVFFLAGNSCMLELSDSLIILLNHRKRFRDFINCAFLRSLRAGSQSKASR